MNAEDKNLFLRIARRLEERANSEYAAAAGEPRMTKAGARETARRRRDRDLGDARDLRDFVKRSESTAPEAGNAG